MKTFTKQETFDTVVAHLRQQGCRANPNPNDSDGGCWYRLPRGNHVLTCAAGCLIPDDKYNPEWEGWSADSLEDEFDIPEVKDSLFFGHNIGFVVVMQKIHDFEPIEKWEARFETVAHDYDLKYTPVGV